MLPKSVFFFPALIQFWASIYNSASEMAFTGNSMKKQELSPILGTLPQVNAFCNKKVIRKNTDCLTLNCIKKVCELYQKVIWVSHTVKSPYKKGLAQRKEFAPMEANSFL